MTTLQHCIELLTEATPFIRSKFGVTVLRIFGSVARGEDGAGSDIDIYVEMPPKALRVVELKLYLQTLLGRAVDVVRSHSHLDPFLRNEIQRDGITVIA